MGDYDYLDDDYEDLPASTKFLKKPSKFEREGSLTQYLRGREGAKNGAKRRITRSG